MTKETVFHVVTLGWGLPLIERLWRRIEEKSTIRFSHIAHPRSTREEWGQRRAVTGIHFLGLDQQAKMPKPDLELLDSMESAGIPTIRNMILGDRVVARLKYDEALGYATFLARRMNELFTELRPSAIVGGFDAIHGGIGLAMARKMHIPWYAMHFSVIPAGLAGFCNALSPAARVQLPDDRSRAELVAFADASLAKFETRRLQAPAYIAPAPLSIGGNVRSVPGRMSALARIAGNAARRKYLRFTDEAGRQSVSSAVQSVRRAGSARRAISRMKTLASPPVGPYALFGLHTQPESSIDVWAPFFSNQMWVIEILARALPPAVRLLVKVHKSDVAKYSREQLEKILSFPGVGLVGPFADGRAFIEKASLVVAIQGTMGLEAALLGKPVIMLGDSPVMAFPSVTRIGEIPSLPELVRRKLTEPTPSRASLVDAFTTYLSPFRSAAHNDWREEKSAVEIADFAALFRLLSLHVTGVNASRGSSGLPS